jgi:hypothetical protein
MDEETIVPAEEIMEETGAEEMPAEEVMEEGVATEEEVIG